MTGFPGFLGSALLPRILRRTDGEALCLVQAKFAALAEQRVEELVAADGELRGRIHLIEGDITTPGLGVDAGCAARRDARRGTSQRCTTWRSARAWRCASTSTERATCSTRSSTVRTWNAFTTSARAMSADATPGPFAEDDLEVGAPFNNYYEETKHLAEVDVRRRMAAGLPATIYRPSIVVGDSRTGETQKYDGPYFIMQWLLRQPKPRGAARRR